MLKYGGACKTLTEENGVSRHIRRARGFPRTNPGLKGNRSDKRGYGFSGRGAYKPATKKMIYGIGIEIVDIGRFKSAMERRGEKFYKRLFTERELAYCLRHKRPEVHLAARFAGKVSLFKALGRRLKFRDVEILREDGGAPVLKVRGLGAAYKLNISISHTEGFAVAETVVEN